MNALEARRRMLGAGVYKKTVTGNPAIAQGSLARMYPGIEMQGWTEQDGTPTPENPVPIVSAGNWNEETQKYEYGIKLTGAQLFDVSQLQEVSMVLNDAHVQRNGVEITGLEPGQYTISTKQKTIGTIAYLYAIVKNSSGEYGKVQYIVTNIATNIVVISISSGDTLIVYDARKINTVEVPKALFDEYGVMVNAGSTALPYEPYKPPQTVTLTSDRPLTKWDKLEKRGGQWGWEYKSAEIVCDGSEQWQLTGVTSDEYQGFALSSSDYNAMKSNLILVCDRFPYSKSDKINTCRQENSEYGLRFVVSTEYVPNKTVAEFKNWLQSNPITVLYRLAEPVFTPLSETEQEQMNALYTFRPTTVLSNDAGCEMSLTYKTRKSMGVTT